MCEDYDPHDPDSYYEFRIINIANDTDWDRIWKNIASPAFMDEMIQQMFEDSIFCHPDDLYLDPLEDWYGW